MDIVDPRPQNLVIRDFREVDAGDLARMLNESEEGWPGGLTGGVPFTAETLLEKMRSTDAIAHLVAELNGRIVGYLELTKHWSSEDATYISLVNVHPNLRGRGIGTRLIKEAVVRSISIGARRIDLHTWPGNSRAIRLYKKLGFFWVPETSVYMQNFIPLILANPTASEFFSRHPDALYGFRRDLSVEEDRLKYRGRSVYIYEWSIDGDYLKAIVDRYGWDLCGLEWSSGLVELLTEDDRVVRGSPFKAYWRIVNRSNEKFKVVLIPEPGENVKLLSKPPVAFEVKPGEEKVVEAEAVVDIEAEDKPRDEPSRKLKSKLIVNGRVFSLSIGFDEKAPLSIKPIRMPSLLPQSTDTILLDLCNNFKRSVSGRIVVVPSEGLEVEPRVLSFTAHSEEKFTLPLKVKVMDPLLYKSKLTLLYDVEGIRSPPIDLFVTISRIGEATGYVDRKRKVAVVDLGDYFIRLRFRGGRIDVIRKSNNNAIFSLAGESIGPPFWPSELSRVNYYVELEEGRESIRLYARARLRKIPGIELVKVLEVKGSSPVLKLSYTIVNNSSIKRNVKLRIDSRIWWRSRLVVPLKEGILNARAIPGEFPASREDLPSSPSEYAEYWTCHITDDGYTVGLLWGDRGLDKIDFARGGLPRLTYLIELKPHSRVKMPPLYIYIGGGGWRDVRRLYWMLFRRKHLVPEVWVKETIDVVELAFRPSPLVMEDESCKAELVLRRNRGKVLKGRIMLSSEDLDVEPREFEIQELRDRVFSKAVRIRRKAIGCAEVSCVLYSNYGTFRRVLPVISFGKGNVSVELNGSKATVDNGYLTFKVDASFAGTLYEITTRDFKGSHLFSSYPKPSELSWIRPWYGGVRLCDGWSDNLWREEWRIDKAVMEKWVGVKLYTKVKYEKSRELRGVRVEQYYLTRPGCSFILLLTRLINETRRYIRPYLWLPVYVSPGGENAKKVIVPLKDGEYEREVYVHEIAYPITSREYILAYNDRAAVVLAKPKRNDLFLGTVAGLDSACALHANIEPVEELKPSEEFSFYLYLAIARKVEDARKYRHLSKLKLSWHEQGYGRRRA